ncbi:PadR family transcriptional regulator [Streptomyces sp. BE303]|uniref:PadR family transcriptional regulator n=1 Tax=Streptomyces sp. BE303 TaxID=3002528 RepID=UPI002E795B9A|nr:PadR family transcriptional regulator [Streptomyces sp. BE303]MED7952509.1 PadR family transcriptional regulator [Streptomyces sp. BE303]
MSLPHAILTALLEKPSSGLELTRRFDKSIGFFWSATHQQIYRELGRLETSGLIRALPQTGPVRGQKKEYEVLPEGRAELARWTAAGDDPKTVREPLLLRLRAAAVVGTAGLDAELHRHLALHRAQLADYRAIERRDFPPGEGDAANPLQHAVLRAGIGLEAFWAQWLTETLATLPSDRTDGGPPGGPARGPARGPAEGAAEALGPS